MSKFKITGKVIRTDDNGTRVLASGSIVKEAESAEALRAAWERDMRIAFPQEAMADIKFFAQVEPA